MKFPQNRRTFLGALAAAAAASPALLLRRAAAQPPELVPTLPVPGDAVALALPDFLALGAVEQIYARYVWVPDGTMKQAAALCLAVNNISRNPTIYRPAVLRDGNNILLRIDLRRLAEDEGEGLGRYLRTWESMDSDPWFRYNAAGPGRTAPKKPAEKKKCEKCRGFGHFNDKSDCPHCVGGFVVFPLVEDRFVPGLHAGGAGPALLMADLGQSDAMIVHGGFFLTRALATVDVGFGRGLYQEFLGIKGKTHKQILEFVGASEEVAAERNTDQRLVQISNVTGRVRVAAFVRASGGASISRSMGIVMWTEDPSQKNYGTDHDAFLNLLDPEFDAIELFAPLPNGLMFSWLGDAAGNPQDAAPAGVVADRRTPEPHPTELQAGIISCGRCHGQAVYGEGKEAAFFQPLNNEVRDLLTLIEPDVDLTALGMTRDEFFKRVSALYEWEPELDVMPLSRIFYARAVTAATTIDGEKPLTTREAWTEIAALHDHYGYARVDATEALRQLGYALPAEADPVSEIFRVIETADEALPLGLTFDARRLKRSDPTLGLLKLKDQFSGEPRQITAVQWAQVYAHAAYKVMLRNPEKILRGEAP